MNSKEYTLPNGKKAVFEYDVTGVGKITLECMDELMSMIADRPQGEWIDNRGANGKSQLFPFECSICHDSNERTTNYCPNCGARMKGADDEQEKALWFRLLPTGRNRWGICKLFSLCVG